MTNTRPTVIERLRRFDLHDPELQADPYPFYAQARSAEPVAWVESHGGHWLLTRYEDIRRVATDPETFLNRQILIPDWPFPLGEQLPMASDGEDHRRYRLALADHFSPTAVNRMEPRMRARAVELVSAIVDRGGGELMADLAVPMANETFLAMFDVDNAVLPDLLRFKDLLVHGGAAGRDELKNEELALVQFFRDLLARRRAEGATGPDVISSMVRGDREVTLSDAEILNISIVLMLASLDTTGASTGNALVWLAEHPDERRRLDEESGLVAHAVEEFLRLEGVTGTVRTVARDTEVGGVAMKAGDKIMMLMGAGNRDPEAFPNPDEVHFDRSSVRHLTFSVGPHRCLGMHLARRTMRIAIEELHNAAPDYRVDPARPPQRVLGHVRGVKSLHVVVGP